MTSDDVRAAWEEADKAGKSYTAAVLAVQQALTAYRKAHPAPIGKFWTWYNDGLRLLDSPRECTHLMCEGESFTCDATPVVAWDDAGGAYCAEHRPKAAST